MTELAQSSSFGRVRSGAAWAAAAMTLAASSARGDEPAVSWTLDTRSPVPATDALEASEWSALTRCAAADARLNAVARMLAERSARGVAAPELDELDFLRRSQGEPHPWPRAWIGAESASNRLEAWLGDSPAHAVRRCGAATATRPDGRRSLAVVAVDAFADLAPLPLRVRAGQWLTVEAILYAPALGGNVFVLGPTGEPRRLATSFEGRTLRARFAPDRPGEFAVQVVANLERGPLPVLEASVFADVEPPSYVDVTPAPGEEDTSPSADPLADRQARGPGDETDRLARMLVIARATSGALPLVRDAALDSVARAHALQMARNHQLAHDAGDGDPVDRLSAEGLESARVGENVAHARSVSLAHRALWASPSHRANVLDPSFSRAGFGVARDDRGEVWVSELFISSSPAPRFPLR
jgi:uncharacterized protein YkwD